VVVNRVFALLLVIATDGMMPADAAVGFDYRGAWVNEPITWSDRAQIVKHGVQSVFTLPGANGQTFDNAENFPALKSVSLAVPAHNSSNLRALSRNYRNLNSLTIRQPQALKTDDVDSLLQLSGLSSLELNCPLSSPERVFNGLRGLKQLELTRCTVGKTTRLQVCLPQLVELTLTDVVIGPDFFENLSAPKLKRLKLFACKIDDGALNRLSTFTRLKEVNLAESVIGDSGLKELETLAFSVSVVLPNRQKLRSRR
jgi:hypothetical protein